MRAYYITADTLGTSTGGGAVTFNESSALKEIGECHVFSRKEMGDQPDPWGYDDFLHHHEEFTDGDYQLCHLYAGTFSRTVAYLKDRGAKITYCAAAHDKEESRKEHESLGIPFAYEHLTDPDLWKRYVQGYLDADVVICPSTHSKKAMKSYDCKRVEVIPHGCDLPKEITPLPKSFVLGYLGSCGAPDKGLKYLLQAWKKLSYKDGSLLLLAGRDSTSPWVRHLISQYGGGNIQLIGWVDDVPDFYNRISCYCQPSVSEGFGLEVLEAMSYDRPVICSTGAGACDLVPEVFRFPARDVDALCQKIDTLKSFNVRIDEPWRKIAEEHTWDKIRERYKTLWRSLL